MDPRAASVAGTTKERKVSDSSPPSGVDRLNDSCSNFRMNVLRTHRNSTGSKTPNIDLKATAISRPNRRKCWNGWTGGCGINGLC